VSTIDTAKPRAMITPLLIMVVIVAAVLGIVFGVHLAIHLAPAGLAEGICRIGKTAVAGVDLERCERRVQVTGAYRVV